MKTPWDDMFARRRSAVEDSIGFRDATDVESRLHQVFGHLGGAGDWEQRFLDFIERHRGERLLSATAGDGIEIVFSPRDAAGYWLWETGGGACGKGLLTVHDAGRLLEVARLKGLVAD